LIIIYFCMFLKVTGNHVQTLNVSGIFTTFHLKKGVSPRQSIERLFICQSLVAAIDLASRPSHPSTHTHCHVISISRAAS